MSVHPSEFSDRVRELDSLRKHIDRERAELQKIVRDIHSALTPPPLCDILRFNLREAGEIAERRLTELATLSQQWTEDSVKLLWEMQFAGERGTSEGEGDCGEPSDDCGEARPENARAGYIPGGGCIFPGNDEMESLVRQFRQHAMTKNGARCMGKLWSVDGRPQWDFTFTPMHDYES